MKKWKSFEVVKIQNITCLFWIIIQTFECFNIFFYSQHQTIPIKPRYLFLRHIVYVCSTQFNTFMRRPSDAMLLCVCVTLPPDDARSTATTSSVLAEKKSASIFHAAKTFTQLLGLLPSFRKVSESDPSLIPSLKSKRQDPLPHSNSIGELENNMNQVFLYVKM